MLIFGFASSYGQDFRRATWGDTKEKVIQNETLTKYKKKKKKELKQKCIFFLEKGGATIEYCFNKSDNLTSAGYNWANISEGESQLVLSELSSTLNLGDLRWEQNPENPELHFITLDPSDRTTLIITKQPGDQGKVSLRITFLSSS